MTGEDDPLLPSLGTGVRLQRFRGYHLLEGRRNLGACLGGSGGLTLERHCGKH